MHLWMTKTYSTSRHAGYTRIGCALKDEERVHKAAAQRPRIDGDGIKLRYRVNREFRRHVWWRLGWPSVPELHVFSASAEAVATTSRRSVQASRVSLRDNSSDKRLSKTIVFIVPIAFLDFASQITCRD